MSRVLLPITVDEDDNGPTRLVFEVSYDALRSGAFAEGKEVLFRFNGKNHLMRIDSIEPKDPFRTAEICCTYVSTQGEPNVSSETGPRQA